MPATWTVFSEIRFLSNGVKLFTELTAATREATEALALLNKETKEFADINIGLSREIGKTTSAYTRQTRRVTEATAAMQRYAIASREASAVAPPAVMRNGSVRAAGRAAGASEHHIGPATIAGLGALATLAVGVKSAADFQERNSQVAVASGLSSAESDRIFRPIALQMSMKTAQSMTDTMGMLQGLVTSGFNDPKDLQRNNAALPMAIAKFADTQYLGKHHVDFQTSVTQAAQLAHQLGTRSAAQLEPMLNTLFKISQDMPDSLKTAATQIKYYGPQYTNAGVDPSEILQLQATADRLGLGGGRSGTGFRALLASMQFATSDRMFKAQQDLGLISGVTYGLDKHGRRVRTGDQNRYIDEKTGRYDVEGFFKHLHDLYTIARREGKVSEFNTKLGQISTSGAGSVLSLFSSDAGQEQRKAVAATMKRVADLDKAQAQLMDNLNSQTKTLVTNFSSLSAIIAGPLMRPLTELVRNLQMALGASSTYLMAHPVANVAATTGLVAASAFGAYKLLQLVGGISAFAHLAAEEAKRSTGVGARIFIPRPRSVGGTVAEVGEEAAAAGGVGALIKRIFRRVPRVNLPTSTVVEGAEEVAAHGKVGLIGGAAAFGFNMLKNAATLKDTRAFGAEATSSFGAIANSFKFLRMGVGVGLPTILRTTAEGIFRVGTRFIPFIGELMLLGDIITNLPKLSIAVQSWWDKNSKQVAYSIGFGMQSVASIVLSGIGAMLNAIKAGAWAYITSFGDAKKVSDAEQAAYKASIKADPRSDLQLLLAGASDARDHSKYGRSLHAYVDSADGKTIRKGPTLGEQFAASRTRAIISQSVTRNRNNVLPLPFLNMGTKSIPVKFSVPHVTYELKGPAPKPPVYYITVNQTFNGGDTDVHKQAAEKFAEVLKSPGAAFRQGGSTPVNAFRAPITTIGIGSGRF